MLCAAFWFGGKTRLVLIGGNQESEKHTKTLQEHFCYLSLPLSIKITGYQQDNAAIHTSKHTKVRFESYSIKVLPWSAKSPDLNPIENL